MRNSDGGIGARLHSRYQPQLEADRYVSALNPGHDVDYFILIEPGLGYLIPSLRASHPNSKIVVLHADACFRETESRYPDVPIWFPDCGMGVQEFLEEKIPEGASVRIIEWRPSLNVFGDMCLKLVRECTEFIKRAEAGRRTGAAFGRRWVKNFFRNLSLLEMPLQYRTLTLPIVITGSGPSLEAALPEIRSARDGIFIMAASSSLPALAAGGITPDMVIATDGGGWALLHLYACFRTASKMPLTHTARLALNLCAAVPSQCAALGVLTLNDGSLWQSIALHSVGIPSVLVPQRGTVTASALEMALVLGTGTIFLAGMNLATQDIRTHARPYGFDHLFEGASSRLRPLYSQYFMRSGDIKAGGSHDVYAAWFGNKMSSWPKRIFSLGGNHAVFGNLPQGNIQERRDLPRSTGMQSMPRSFTEKEEGTIKTPCSSVSSEGYFQVVTLNGSPSERRTHALETLIAALDKGEYATALCGELAPLLFPGRSDVLPGEIAQTLAALGSHHG